jgi:branched-chain amino acid transport system substrate-binding protein
VMAQRAPAGRLRVGACMSLSGRYARFGTQAARALDIWRTLDGAVDLVIEDDRSDRHALELALRRVAQTCDVLLGPYSTQLMRVAGRMAADEGWLLWNHGGSGDDVEAAYPGHVISVLTPTSRYAEPFLRLVASQPERRRLWIVEGKGSFGRQVAAGAVKCAHDLDIDVAHVAPEELTASDGSASWDLFSAGTFEDDVELIKQVLDRANSPRVTCAVAAGVHEFADAVTKVDGVFGIAQWFPGREPLPQLGPTEADFLAAYMSVTGSQPDYPAVQAVAAAVLGVHCARSAGGEVQDLAWSTAAGLDTTTLFGPFKIDSSTGVQVAHEMALVRWTQAGDLTLV